jgi:hypothetical protein
MEAMPKETRVFLQKETRWAISQSKSDWLLETPRPNHDYVDKKRRLTFNDTRFSALEVAETSGRIVKKTKAKVKNALRIPTAGIPSDKPYTPRRRAAPESQEIPILGSPEDPAFHTIAFWQLAFQNLTNYYPLPPQEEAFHARPSVKLIIPDPLKGLLVDDWENVTKNNQLVPLPHPNPVTKILEDYAAYETPKRVAGSSHVDILEETLSGLKEYFDKSLGRVLLYK